MANPVVGEIKREARRRHAPFKQLKAAIETGIVESGLRNLPGGTGDSAGWRQERRSLYPDPTNVQASVRRFFDEAAAKDRPGVSSGELAAEVQRPAAQYRGRYAQEAAKAQSILEGLSGTPFNDQVASTGMRVVNTLKTGSALDTRSFEDAKRLSIVGQMLARRHGTDSPLFRSGVLSTQAPNPSDFMRPALTGSVSAVGTGTGTTSSAGLPHGHSPLFELFWQGPNGINAKNGQREPQGFVSGHTDHVHVAAGPNTVVALGRMAQQMGLHVGENPHFGGVNPVHAKNSFHYRNEAIDVSGDPKAMAHYAHTVARKFGVR